MRWPDMMEEEAVVDVVLSFRELRDVVDAVLVLVFVLRCPRESMLLISLLFTAVEW